MCFIWGHLRLELPCIQLNMVHFKCKCKSVVTDYGALVCNMGRKKDFLTAFVKLACVV
jgi:hypothetical protein